MVDGNILALKNAWRGAETASDDIKILGVSVFALPDEASVADLDLEAFHRVALAQSNAVMALRGLIEELRRKRAGE